MDAWWVGGRTRCDSPIRRYRDRPFRGQDKDPNIEVLAAWADERYFDISQARFLIEVPRAIRLIVAHEWGTTPDVVSTWTWQQFIDALQWVAERRYGKAWRSQERTKRAQSDRSHAALKD